jgi:hypothetical protein
MCYLCCLTDSSQPEPGLRAKDIASVNANSGPYRRLLTECKDIDTLPTSEAEEKINFSGLNRKRPGSFYGAKRRPEKFKMTARDVPREDISSEDDAPAEPPTLNFVTAKQKWVG